MEKIDKPKPLSYRFHEVHKMFMNKIKKETDNLGINPSFRFIFMVLLENKDGVSQSKLCELTHFKKSSISLLLKQMESEELITREKSNNDNRLTIVRLTDKGKKLDLKIKQIFIKNEEKLSMALDSDELANLEIYLNKLINALKEDNNNV